MTIIHEQTSDLLKDGPLIDVHIGLPSALANALTKNGDPLPPPVKLLAMVDTGAHMSVVEAGILNPLGLKPVGTISVLTPTSSGGGTPCNQYAARLYIPNESFDMVLTEAPLQGQTINMLIGRDLLENSVLIYNGIAKSFTLSF